MKKTLMSALLGVAVLSVAVSYAGASVQDIKCPVGQYVAGIQTTSFKASQFSLPVVMGPIKPDCQPVVGNQSK